MATTTVPQTTRLIQNHKTSYQVMARTISHLTFMPSLASNAIPTPGAHKKLTSPPQKWRSTPSHRRLQASTSSKAPATPRSTTTFSKEAARRLRKGDAIDIHIVRLGYGGTGVGHIASGRIAGGPPVLADDLALPVHAPKGTCPGDSLRCFVTRVRRKPARKTHVAPSAAPPHSFVEVAFAQRLSESPVAQQPACHHFGHFRLGGGGCGGCSSMQLPYHMQVEQKNEQMNSLYGFLTDLHGVPIQPIIPCRNTFNFRNKMEFTSGRRWFSASELNSKQLLAQSQRDHIEYAIGLHPPQRFDKILQISQCHIQPTVGNHILQFVRSAISELLLEPFDTKTNQGYFRHLVIRTATNADEQQEIMINLITSACEVPHRLVPLAHRIMAAFPQVVCVLQNIRGVTGTHITEDSQQRLLAGDRAYIEQSLCGVTFRISANSFFQTNTEQAAVLYDQVARAARLCENDVVLDLFCGTGTIGLTLAASAKHVHGVDVTASAIADARVNAHINGIGNTTFTQLNLEKMRTAKRFVQLPHADVVIIDPPRAGLHPDLIRYFAETTPKRIVYVSCNPMTQLRDLVLLDQKAPGGFRVTLVQPVDMFPHSHHVECVVCLERV